jgi:uncharacterized protein YjbJ (UPF0337 family)
MDKDRIAGAAKQAKAAIKETAGKVVGDTKLAAEGKSGKVEGKIQNVIGGAKDAEPEVDPGPGTAWHYFFLRRVRRRR